MTPFARLHEILSEGYAALKCLQKVHVRLLLGVMPPGQGAISHDRNKPFQQAEGLLPVHGRQYGHELDSTQKAPYDLITPPWALPRVHDATPRPCRQYQA